MKTYEIKKETVTPGYFDTKGVFVKTSENIDKWYIYFYENDVLKSKQLYSYDGEKKEIEIPVDFIEKGFAPSPIDLIIAEYDKHEENGKQLHKQIRALLVLRLKNKELTLNNVLAIEDKLSNVTNNVKNGDWLTAKAKLEAAQTNGVFTDELKAEILDKINNYITANYK